MIIRKLDAADVGYALFSWRESAKKAPEYDRVPWDYYKDAIVPTFQKLLETGVVLGAYDGVGSYGLLHGWLAMSPGKRVHAVHWCHVKHSVDDVRTRRAGTMTALLNAADLGSRFIYTLHARRLMRDEREKHPGVKTLDELLVAALRERGVTATYISLKEWSA
jgi:hypothetical protein